MWTMRIRLYKTSWLSIWMLQVGWLVYAVRGLPTRTSMGFQRLRLYYMRAMWTRMFGAWKPLWLFIEMFVWGSFLSTDRALPIRTRVGFHQLRLHRRDNSMRAVQTWLLWTWKPLWLFITMPVWRTLLYTTWKLSPRTKMGFHELRLHQRDNSNLLTNRM